MEPTHLAMYYQTSTFLPLVQIGTPVRLTNLCTTDCCQSYTCTGLHIHEQICMG